MRRWIPAAFAVALVLGLNATPAAAQGDVSVGHSGWRWGNPQPQGNTLRAVEFAGGVGYAAGDFGTLLRTADGGQTWTGIATGITADLSRIRAVDANTVLIGAGCVLRRSDDGGATFRRVPFTNSESDCPAGLASFHFPTPQRGYLVLSDGTVQTTSDGGQTFSGATAIPGTPAGAGGGQATPTDVYFLTETLGFVTAGGVIYRTTDGGNSWEPRFQAGAPLASLVFVDANTGYAVGAGNTLAQDGERRRRVDAQADPRGHPAVGPDADPLRADGRHAQTCLISTAAGDRALRTTDGGDTITSLSTSTRPIFALAFASPTAAVGVGAAGATVFSADAGTDTPTPSFAPIGARLAGGDINLFRVRATDSSIVHATGDNGKLARTTDGGRNWSTVGVPTSEDLADASFVNANEGFTIDTAGTLRFTSDGGARWTPLDTGTTPSVAAIHAVDRNVAMLFTARGIFRSAAASDTSSPGTTFEPVDNVKLQRTQFSDFDQAGGVLFAWGPTAIWVSTNQGRSWKTVRGPLKKPRYGRVDFVSSKVGFAYTAGGRIWRTANGGRTWSELLGAGTSLVQDLAMADARNGYLTIGSFPGAEGRGSVLRTSDGGATWRPQLISAVGITQIEAPGADSAFSLAAPGGGSNLFRTTAGGNQGSENAVTVSASPKKLRKAGNVKLTVKVSPNVIGAAVPLFVRTKKSRALDAGDGARRGDDQGLRHLHGDGQGPIDELLRRAVARRRRPQRRRQPGADGQGGEVGEGAASAGQIWSTTASAQSRGNGRPFSIRAK